MTTRRRFRSGPGLLTTAILAAGCGDPAPPRPLHPPSAAGAPRRDQSPPIRAAAAAVWRAYRADAAAAAELYGGRLVEVVGEVQAVSEAGGRYAVGFRTGPPGEEAGVVAWCGTVPPGVTVGVTARAVGVGGGVRTGPSGRPRVEIDAATLRPAVPGAPDG